MIFPIENVLSIEELKYIVDSLTEAEFVDGKNTAGWSAKLVKNNTQLEAGSERGEELREMVIGALKRNPLFEVAIRPRYIHSVMFSRYEPGMYYGPHVDNAFLGGKDLKRSDVSFTLFLASPSSYTGGELVIEYGDGERAYKLEAGSAIVYPSTFLHRVETVTEGARLAAVGWVQSLIRDANDRELLFDLDTARRSIFTKEGKTIEFDLLSKCHSNLLRKWSD